MSFSKTAIKRIKAMTKNELVDMVLQLNNYGENQKAQNIILLKMVEDLQKQIPKQEGEQK